MSPAAGRYHASGKPSLSCAVFACPCRCVTIGTGPAHGPGVAVKPGRESRSLVPPPFGARVTECDCSTATVWRAPPEITGTLLVDPRELVRRPRLALDDAERDELRHAGSESGALDDPDHALDVLVGEGSLLREPPVGGAADDDALRGELTAQL